MLGHGGIRLVAQAAGVREATVSLGVDELDAGPAALLALVEPDERGDPMSPLRWTTKSTRSLAGELTSQGHKVGADTVGTCGPGASACRATPRPSKASGTRDGPHQRR